MVSGVMNRVVNRMMMDRVMMNSVMNGMVNSVMNRVMILGHRKAGHGYEYYGRKQKFLHDVVFCEKNIYKPGK